MLIHEVSKRTNLTKKAIEYYTLQGLLSPKVLPNGYRDYGEQAIERLGKISVLRKLDIPVDKIKQILEDTTQQTLQAIAIQKELDYRSEMRKKSILERLSQGSSYETICVELESIEKSKSITDNLREAFPGFYGRFLCMYYARFLNKPIQTQAQQAAYQTILTFLDNLPTINLPMDLEEYMIEHTKHIGTKEIEDMLARTTELYQNADQFFAERKALLTQYAKFKESEEYRNSPACKVLELLKSFHNSSGYYEVFIPAMRILSDSYAEYYHQVEAANVKLLARCPEIRAFAINDNGR